ncbi:MAG: serine/threonine-protein kinase [Gemmatimonadota bacterium]
MTDHDFPATIWQRLSDLLEESQGVAVKDRVAWLDQLPAADAGLRQELERLLETLPEVDPLFDAPAHALLPADLAVSSLAAGHRFGAWSLVREIARGGMGTVWEAVRVDGEFEQRAALKVVRAALDSAAARQRFRRERQLLARLQHRNIATLLDGGVTAEGTPWFVMELVAGEPITTWSDARHLTVRARLELFRQVCGAVQHAHRALVVHRDLKPGNILVTPDGTVKLLDFGIAKVLDDTESADEAATRPGSTPGTPVYLAPELLRGEPVSTAADVYALGVVGFELLSGRVPFPATGRPSDEWRRTVLGHEAPSLTSVLVDAVTATRGERSLAALQRTVSGDVERIVAMALRQEPDRRYSSAEQFSDDLRRWLANLPVSAQPDSLRYRTIKYVRRNRLTSAALLMATVALLSGLIATTWQARVADRERDRARLEAAKATRVGQFMEETFRAADPRTEGKDVTVAQALATAREHAIVELAAEPAILAGVLSSIGRTYLGLGRYDEADSALRPALALERSRHDGSRTGLLDALHNLATLDAERGRIASAESLFTEALTLARQAPADSLRLGTDLDGYGSLLLDKGDFTSAERTLREAVAVRHRVDVDQPEEIAGTLNNLGVALGQQHRWSEAIPLHREALGLMRRARGPEHPDVATALNTLANAYTITGDYRAADTLFQQAMAQRIRLLGRHHPEVAWTHYSYADMLRLSGDFPRALVEARAVLAERGRTLPETHPMISSALHVYGRSLLATGRSREAEAALRESLRLRRLAYSPGHWLIASAVGAVGECLLAERKYSAAEGMLLEAYQTLQDSKGRADQRTREVGAALDRLHHETGRSELTATHRK